MKAVHMPFDHTILTQLTRDIILERGWKLPDGLIDKRLRDPLSFNLAQWQQAKRIDKAPRAIKAALQDAWAISDSKPALIHALQERGFKMARGNRGRIVVVDHNLEIYALYKWSNQKTKAVKARVGNPTELPSVDEVKDQIRTEMRGMTRRLQSDVSSRSKVVQGRFESCRKALVNKQQVERDALKRGQDLHRIAANKTRQARFRSGLGAVWDYVRGEHRRIQTQNKHEAYAECLHAQQVRDELVFRHLRERQHIDIFKLRYRRRAHDIQHRLERDRHNYSPLHAPEP